ncbi:unnamed protein product [Agarophyton chilense]
MIKNLCIPMCIAVDKMGPTLNFLDDEDSFGSENKSASVSKDKPDGPENYKLSKDAEAAAMIIANETGQNRPDVLQL